MGQGGIVRHMDKTPKLCPCHLPRCRCQPSLATQAMPKAWSQLPCVPGQDEKSSHGTVHVDLREKHMTNCLTGHDPQTTLPPRRWPSPRLNHPSSPVSAFSSFPSGETR